MNEMRDNQFLLMLPAYTLVLMPGGYHCFLGNAEAGIAFLPLWGDEAGCQTYLERSGIAAWPMKLATRGELLRFLQAVPANVTDAWLDPVYREQRPIINAEKISNLISILQRDEETDTQKDT